MPESDKMITLAHLKKLAMRGKANSDALISELAELTAAGFEDVQHSGITVTLSASGWSERVQTVQNEFLLADRNYWYFVCGDADNFAAWSEACISADNITANGQITFHCLATPTVDLSVNILRLEVEL